MIPTILLAVTVVGLGVAVRFNERLRTRFGDWVDRVNSGPLPEDRDDDGPDYEEEITPSGSSEPPR